MKILKKSLTGMTVPTVFAIALLSSSGAMAANYSSQISLPVLHSKGYLYTASLPVPKSVKAGQIKNVSWNWNFQGWPRGMEVFFCQAGGQCVDVSRLRSGSTELFKGGLVSRPFYFTFKLAPSGPAPIAGGLGKVTVTW